MKRSILVVEDNTTKRDEIERAVKGRWPQFDVAGAPSIATAYRALDRRSWDLIILDMTFQVSQAGGGVVTSEPLAGIELLQFISKKRNRSPVIVATQHSSFTSPGLPGIDTIAKLDDFLKDLFPENYRGIILVDLTGEAWKGQLQAAMSEVLDV
jgi:CheY-like chemotaxis protein